MTADLVRLKKATLIDSNFFLEVRNHPEVRAKSTHSNVIDFQVHSSWFEKKMKDLNSAMFVIQYEKQNCGTIRYDYDQNLNQAEVSIAILPDFQGKGIAKEALIQSESLILSQFPDTKNFRARVLDQNQVSKNFFNGAGYELSELIFLKPIQSFK